MSDTYGYSLYMTRDDVNEMSELSIKTRRMQDVYSVRQNTN